MPDSPDLSQRLLAQLRFPCGDVPEPGSIKNVAPGIYWLRMPLPFQLNHINLWLVEEADGWTIVDTGINTPETRELWEKIFAEKLSGKPVKRVIATHLHPDHVGLAGWLCGRWDAPLWMTLGEYMSAIAARNDFIENEDLRATHLARNGVPADKIPLFHRHKGGYAKGVAMKAALGAVTMLAVRAIEKRNKKAAVFTMIAANVATAAVVANNVRNARRLK